MTQPAIDQPWQFIAKSLKGRVVTICVSAELQRDANGSPIDPEKHLVTSDGRPVKWRSKGRYEIEGWGRVSSDDPIAV